MAIVLEEITTKRFAELLKIHVPSTNWDINMYRVVNPRIYYPTAYINTLELYISDTGYIPEFNARNCKVIRTADDVIYRIDTNNTNKNLIKYAQHNEIKDSGVIAYVLKIASKRKDRVRYIPDYSTLTYTTGSWVLRITGDSLKHFSDNYDIAYGDANVHHVIFKENQASKVVYSPDAVILKKNSSYSVLDSIDSELQRAILFNNDVRKFYMCGPKNNVRVTVQMKNGLPPRNIPKTWDIEAKTDNTYYLTKRVFKK